MKVLQQFANLKSGFLAIFIALIFTSIPYSKVNADPLNQDSVTQSQLLKLSKELQLIANQISNLQSANTLLDTIESNKIIPQDTAWVEFRNKKLWPIYFSNGTQSPQERADLVMFKFNALSIFEIGEVLDSLKLTPTEEGVNIGISTQVYFSVTSKDAQFQKETTSNLASKYLQLIKHQGGTQVLLENNEDIFWRVGKVLVVIFILYLLVKLLNIGFRKTNDYIVSLRGGRIKGIKIKNFEIINDLQVVRIFLFVSKLIRLFLVLLLVYLSLPIIFGLFPWTETLAGTLLGYVLDPIKEYFWLFIHYIPNLISIIIISYFGHFAIRFVKYLAGELESGNLTIAGFYPEWAKPTSNLVKFALYIILLIFIFPFLPGSDSPIFKGVSVFVGIIITMGSSSSVNNIVAGLVLTYMRPFKLGDRVKIESILGFVTEKSLLVTRLRTSKQEIITIPNSKILNTNIINYSTSIQENDGVIIHNTVTIGYDVPWRKVHKALLKAADQIETIAKDPKPFVLQTSLDDFYVAYEINAYVTSTKTIIGSQSTLNECIQDVFRDEGIEILSPHFKAWRDGSEETIPKKGKEDYTFQAEQVDDHTPELDQQKKDEKKLAKEKAKTPKTEATKSFSEIIDKVIKSDKNEEVGEPRDEDLGAPKDTNENLDSK